MCVWGSPTNYDLICVVRISFVRWQTALSGWQTAFAFVGLAGLLWLVFWFAIYRTPPVDPQIRTEPTIPAMTLLRMPFVRAFTIAKIFIYDSRSLEKGYRILSFIALGVVLLVISFVYQRDWLKLSPRSTQSSPKGTSA